MCSGWKDLDCLLQFEFIYFIIEDGVFNVVYKGIKSSVEMKFIVGIKINNFIIDF